MKITLYITLFFCILSLIFGISKKSQYSNIINDINYEDEIYVAGITGKMMDEIYEEFSDNVHNAPVILNVIGEGKAEYFGRTGRQLAKVSKVIKGDGIKKGDYFYLTGERIKLVTYAKPYSIERGFVNEMVEGEEYLVFLKERITEVIEEYPIFPLYDITIISPIFSYQNHNNSISTAIAGTTYMKYSEVKQNEFFCVDEKALKTLMKLKTEIISLYNN